MAQPPGGSANPALSDLNVLIGEWKTDLSNSSFLPDRSSTLNGHTSFRWIEGGAFVAMYQTDVRSGPPQAVWVIGRDQSQPEYEVLYFDNRPMSRIYRMTFQGSTWKMWREAPGFWQRFEASMAKDGLTIAGHWDKSTDEGSTWERDFDLSYAKE